MTVLPRQKNPIYHPLAAIVLLAVLLRVGLALVHPFTQFDDSREYRSLGAAIAADQPYIVNGLRASRMPGYPAYLALFDAIGLTGDRAALCVQAIVAGGGCGLVYLLARDLAPALRLLAVAAAALDPLSVLFSAALLSEALVTVCLLLALVIVDRLCADQRSRLLWLALAAIWSIAVYLHAAIIWCMIPLVLVPALALRRAHARWDRALAGAFITVAIVMATLVPWMVRNMQVLHDSHWRFTTLQGISLYEAVYPGATGGPMQDQIKMPAGYQYAEAKTDDDFSKEAWNYIEHDPGRMLRLAVVKFGRFWALGFNAREYSSPLVNLALAAWHLPLFILALIGAFFGPLSAARRGILLIPIAYLSLLHMVFQGSVRYRVPLMPLLCVLALAGLQAIREYWRRKSSAWEPE